MRVRLSRLVSNVLFGLSAVLAWLALPPRSSMITALGLPGPSAAEARRCRPVLQRSSLGRIPTGEVMCRAAFDPERPGFRASVSYDAPSRRMLLVAAALWDLDSAAAAFLADSIARTLDARGGQRIECAPIDPVVLDLRRDGLWRFSGFDVRLLSYAPLPHQGKRELNGWHLAVLALPTPAPDCSFVRRLHN